MRNEFLLKRFIDNCAVTKVFDGVNKVLIAVSGGGRFKSDGTICAT